MCHNVNILIPFLNHWGKNSNKRINFHSSFLIFDIPMTENGNVENLKKSNCNQACFKYILLIFSELETSSASGIILLFGRIFVRSHRRTQDGAEWYWVSFYFCAVRVNKEKKNGKKSVYFMTRLFHTNLCQPYPSKNTV